MQIDDDRRGKPGRQAGEDGPDNSKRPLGPDDYDRVKWIPGSVMSAS